MLPVGGVSSQQHEYLNMASFEFTEEEIRNELARFGIKDIDQSTLREFREDLLNLMKESSSNSLQNVDTLTTTSPSFNNTPYTCSNLSSPLSPTTPFTISSSLLTSPTGKNIDDVKSHPACTSHNSLEPSSVIDTNRPQNTNESSRPVACRKAWLFNSADKVDGHSEITLGRHHTQIQLPSENEYEKQENLLHSFNRKNVAQPNQVISFDNPKNKENIWSRQPVPSSPVSVTKPSQMTSITTENNGMTNYLQETLNKPAPLVNTFVTKRKISRKGPDGKRYIDESESVCSSSTSSSTINSCCSSIVDPAEYQNRLREMTNRDRHFYQKSVSLSDGRPKSTIIVAPSQKNKTDPVNRFHEFQSYWNLHKTPGENNHNALRWSIREKNTKHVVIESRPRKTFVPNNYVIPSLKPRHSLRWQIRTDLAYGFMPSASYNDY